MFAAIGFGIADALAGLTLWAVARGYPFCGLRCDFAFAVFEIIYLPAGLLASHYAMKRVLPWYLR